MRKRIGREKKNQKNHKNSKHIRFLTFNNKKPQSTFLHPWRGKKKGIECVWPSLNVYKSTWGYVYYLWIIMKCWTLEKIKKAIKYKRIQKVPMRKILLWEKKAKGEGHILELLIVQRKIKPLCEIFTEISMLSIFLTIFILLKKGQTQHVQRSYIPSL